MQKQSLGEIFKFILKWSTVGLRIKGAHSEWNFSDKNKIERARCGQTQSNLLFSVDDIYDWSFVVAIN